MCLPKTQYAGVRRSDLSKLLMILQALIFSGFIFFHAVKISLLLAEYLAFYLSILKMIQLKCADICISSRKQMISCRDIRNIELLTESQKYLVV